MNSTATTAELLTPILQQVSIATGVKPETMISDTRDSPAAKARQTAMCLAVQLTTLSFSDIAAHFRRDLSAVQYAMDRVLGRCATDPVAARQYQQLMGQRTALRELRPYKERKRRPAPAQPLPVIIASDIVATSTHGRIDELGESTLRRRLISAEEDLIYWQGKKFRALDPREKSEAGARVQIWEMQVDAIRRQLQRLNRLETLTA
jgi:hypothetical protein